MSCFNMCCDSDNQSESRLISDRDQSNNVCTLNKYCPRPVCVGLWYLYCIHIWKKVQSNTVRTLVYSHSLSLVCSCASSNNGACFRSWFLSADWHTFQRKKSLSQRKQKETHASTHIWTSEHMESYANADMHWNMGTSHKHAVKTHTHIHTHSERIRIQVHISKVPQHHAFTPYSIDQCVSLTRHSAAFEHWSQLHKTSIFYSCTDQCTVLSMSQERKCTVKFQLFITFIHSPPTP